VIDVVRVGGEHIAEEFSLGLVVGGLEAADQLEERRQDLFGQLGRDDVLVLAAVGEDGRSRCFSPRLKSRSAQSSKCRAAKIGRPATWTISATLKVA